MIKAGSTRLAEAPSIIVRFSPASDEEPITILPERYCAVVQIYIFISFNFLSLNDFHLHSLTLVQRL